MKFLADHMLGKLAKDLRVLGFDTKYYHGGDGRGLLEIARREGRIILTRRTKDFSPATDDGVVYIVQDQPSLQMRELIREEIILRDQATPFSRCLLCNALLTPIDRGEAEGKVPDFVFYSQLEFFACPDCGKIYWKGSHQEHMEKRIEELLRG
jgi:uncharacterized protein